MSLSLPRAIFSSIFRVCTSWTSLPNLAETTKYLLHSNERKSQDSGLSTEEIFVSLKFTATTQQVKFSFGTDKIQREAVDKAIFFNEISSLFFCPIDAVLGASSFVETSCV